MGGRIRMYNVEFGDAFLLYGDGENLLVDLGSIQDSFCFDPVRDSIREECVNGRLSLLLTHFHRDHWSGLHDQRKGHQLPHLNMVYLPDIFQMRYYAQLDVIMKSLLGDFLESVVLRQKPRFSLADLLREVLPGLPKGRICLLCSGEVFEMGGRRYEVLWPRLDRETVVGKRNKALAAFLERLEGKLAAGGAESRLWDTLEAMANALLRDFALVLEGEISTVIRAERRTYEDLYEKARRLSEILAENLRWDEGEFRRKVQYYAERLAKDWNQVSLVFQERIEARGEACENIGVLMTGDITKSILTKLANGKLGAPRLRESYAVIKAPHHGTEAHFCAILPRCRYVCISNGEGNHRYKKITEQYEHVYGCLGKKTDIRCTNPRCEFLETKGHCPYFHTRPIEDFYDICW